MQVHILNGDALQLQLPENIWGETIVMRECLVDGEVNAENLLDFFSMRSAFMEKAFGINPTEYQLKSEGEIRRILEIESGTNICLWFEEDLFCQVNLWFVAYLLVWHNPQSSVALVLPNSQNPYSFGGMNVLELEEAFAKRRPLNAAQMFDLAQLWKFYQTNSFDGLQRIAALHSKDLPFLSAAVAAHVARFSADGGEGRPEAAIKTIMDRLGTTDFGPIFKEFCRTEAIYGYGDAQVQRILEKILSERKN